MGRTCGEPDEIKKNTHPKSTTALFRDQVVRKFELDACHVRGHAVQITVPEPGGAEGSARRHGSAVTVRLADG